MPANLCWRTVLRYGEISKRFRLRLSVGQARLRINPEVEISSESYPLFESRPGAFFNNQEWINRVTQTFETAGKRGKRTAVAETELSATESDVQNTVRQLILELKRRY
jgi:hypothetical protein